MPTKQTFESAMAAFNDHKFVANTAEIHGLLCGMLCGGLGHTDTSWMATIIDTTNSGEPVNEHIERVITDIFNQTCQQLIESEFALNLLLPEDDAPINQRGIALVEWVQGFLAGFGMQQKDLTSCSDDVKEAMHDFTDIARMEEPMEDDEESERAFEEVVEYVRMSAMLCFSELGKSLLDDAPNPPMVH